MNKLKMINNNVYLKKGNKCIGYLQGSDTFRCQRKYEMHLYRKLHSWCISSEILQLGIKYIVIDVNDAGQINSYGIKISKLVEFKSKYDITINYNKFEKQFAIPLALWDFKYGINKDKLNKGVSVEVFDGYTNEPRMDYSEWKKRKINNDDLDYYLQMQKG